MKKNGVKSDTNVFKSAVDNTVELKDGYCKGLQALKGNSLKVSVSKQQHLLGSVDIDNCTKGLYPNASRWDYAIGYDQKAWFVEVHPANTSNVKEMLKKVEWLESWLKDKGCNLLKSGAIICIIGFHPARYAYQRLHRSIGVWQSISFRLRPLLSS